VRDYGERFSFVNPFQYFFLDCDKIDSLISGQALSILFAAEWCRPRVRPRILVRPVVGCVEHDGVVADAEVVDRLENLADRCIVFDHTVSVFGSGV